MSMVDEEIIIKVEDLSVQEHAPLHFRIDEESLKSSIGMLEETYPISPTPSVLSVLTRITNETASEGFENIELCLLTAKESFGLVLENFRESFPQISDPGIIDYMRETKTKTDEYLWWERYKTECHMYSVPQLTPIKDVFQERTYTLDLKRYCPQSIGLSLGCDVLHAKKSKIKHIDISCSPFTESGCPPLCEIMVASTMLQSLNLAHCKIGQNGAKALEMGFNYMQTMLEMNLSNCNLKDDGGVIVVNALRTNVTLKVLNLSHNQLNTKSGRALNDLFEQNQTLQDLDLGWNLLNDETECLKYMFDGLIKNTALLRLNLSWNGIQNSPNFCEKFKKCITKNKVLQYLSFEYNRFQGDMEDFWVGLLRTKGLIRIDLGGNPFTEADIFMFLEIFKKKTKIKEISLGEFRILSEDQLKALEKVQKKNQQLEIIFQRHVINPARMIDGRELLVDRMKFLASKPKGKKKRDIGHFFCEIVEEDNPMCDREEFQKKLSVFGAKLDDALINGVCDEWLNLKTGRVYILEMAQYYLGRHPTAPKEKIVPVTAVVEKKKGKKGNKEKKGKTK